MQRGFMPRRTAVLPRNALRVADKQSFGLLVGFLLRYVRLAARGLRSLMTVTFGSAARTVKGGIP